MLADPGISEAPSKEEADRSWPGSRTTMWSVLALVALAFVLRVIYVLQIRASPFFDQPVMDPLYHVTWAKALAAGETFDPGRPFFRAPLYPWFLGLCFRLFGESYLVPRLLQAGFGAATTGLCFLLGREVFNRRTGLLAALFAATYWVLIYFDGELLIPTLAVPLDLLALWLSLRLAREPGPRSALLTGATWGLAAIARPNVLLFMPFLAVWLLWRWRPEWGRGFASTAALTLGTLLPIAPLTAYNAAQGDPVFIASQWGVNLWIGNNPKSDGSTAIVPGTRPGWWQGYRDAIALAEAAEGRALKASEVSGHYAAKAWNFMTENPGAALRHFLWKLRLFWTDWELGNNQAIRFMAFEFGPLLRFLPLRFWLLAPLGLLGFALAARSHGARAFPLFAFLPVYMASVVLFFVCSRYRVPVLPVLMVFAAHACLRLGAMVNRRAWLPLGASGVAVALVLIPVLRVPSQLDTTDAPGLHRLGLIAQKQGRHAEALGLFQEALAAGGMRSRLTYFLITDSGRSLQGLGRYAEAEREYERAIALVPGMVQAREALAYLLLEQGHRLSDALRVAQELAREVPHFAGGHCVLGRSYARLGRHTDAIAAFQEGLRLDPTHFGCTLDIAQEYAKGNQWAEAELHLRRALAARTTFDGSYWFAARQLLQLYRASGQPQAGARFIEELQIRHGDSPEIRNILQLWQGW